MCLFAQIKAVVVENTFTSIEDVAPRLFPLLGLFIGPRRCLLLAVYHGAASFTAVLQDAQCHCACAMPRWFNFLVRNKWESKRDIQHLARLPVLLLSSLKVSSAALLTWPLHYPHACCGHASGRQTVKRGIVSWGHLLQDEMLPPEHMLQLYNVLKAAGSKRVVWTEFPTGNHMETYELCRQEYWPAVRAFFQQNIASGAVATVIMRWGPPLPLTADKLLTM